MSVLYQLRKRVCISLCGALMLSFWAVGTGNAETSNQPVFTATEWPPVIYLDEEGEMHGLYAEILPELFEKRMGMNLQYRLFPWRRAQQQVKDGLADLIIAIPNAERLQYAVSSKRPFLELYLNVYTYKNHPRLKEIEHIKTIDDIKEMGLTTVSNMGNGWQKAHIEAAGIPTFYVLSEQEACLFLAKKRADIMIDAVITTNHIIKNLGLSSELELTKARFGPINLHLLMSKKSKFLELMPKIDKTFGDLEAEGVLGQLLKSYNTLP